MTCVQVAIPFLGHFLNGSDIPIGTVPRWKRTFRGGPREEMLTHCKMKLPVEVENRGVDEGAIDVIKTLVRCTVRGRG